MSGKVKVFYLSTTQVNRGRLFGMALSGILPDTTTPPARYLYNNKEFEKEGGVYFYGARLFVSMIGRFAGVDPLADQFPGWTSYHYVHNNPLRYTDPTGMSADDIIVEGQKYIPGSSPAAGSSKFVNETFAALNQIVNGTDKQAVNLVTGLANNSNVEVDIISSNVTTEASVSIVGHKGGEMAGTFQTLYFDTDRGIEETATGKTFSPDVALVHELGHIQNALDSPANFISRRGTPDAIWKNLEEKETTTKYEVPYAGSRRMLQRTGYAKGYKPVKTINSTNAITTKQFINIMRAIGSF